MPTLAQGEAPEPAPPIALVFTDMVGSSAAKRSISLGPSKGTRDDAYLTTIQSRHLKLVRECVAIHGGREMMTIGDAFFLSFEDAHNALLCCAEIQMRLKAQPIMMPNGRMQLRIGIHVGTPKYFEESWHGTDVDTAARAEAVASPDQIVVTEAAYEHLTTMPGIDLRPLGTFTLKGIGNVPLWDADYDDHGLRPPSVLSVESQQKRRNRNRLKIAAYTATALVILAAAVFAFRERRRLTITDKDSIVLADFENKTLDPVFDGTLRQGLTIQLEQSPFLSLVSDERVQKALTLMGQPANTRPTPAMALEICRRTGGAAVLDGTIAGVGTEYVLGLRARNCRTGEILNEQQAQASRKEEVLNALSQIASTFRTRIGESLATVKDHNTPLAEATTSSLEALQAFSQAYRQLSSTGSATSLSLFKRAVEIDPRFAMAHALLGRAYGDIGESALASSSTSHAYALREHTSDPEKFFIETSYNLVVTGDLDKARQSAEAWAQIYPRDVNAHGLLSGSLYPSVGKYSQAIEEAEKAIACNPDVFFAYVNLASSDLALGRIDDAEKAVQRGQRRSLTSPDSLSLQYQIAWLKKDADTMQRILIQAPKVPAAEDLLTYMNSYAVAFTGHLHQADGLSKHAVTLALTAGDRDRAALFQAGSAMPNAFFGNADTAKRSASAALRLSRVRDVEFGAAFALALAGDLPQAQALADQMERIFPQDTSVRYSYLPPLRALLAVRRHNPAKALDLLQTALPYEMSEPQSAFFAYYGLLYPVYVRGEAYLELHRGAEAAAEFQKILDHPSLTLFDPVASVARLELARAYVLSGDKVRAKAAYQNVLALWQDADPDLPVLKQGKAEYAVLH